MVLSTTIAAIFSYKKRAVFGAVARRELGAPPKEIEAAPYYLRLGNLESRTCDQGRQESSHGDYDTRCLLQSRNLRSKKENKSLPGRSNVGPEIIKITE